MTVPAKPDETCFVGYVKESIAVVDPTTGEVSPTHLFLGVLAATRQAYVETTWDREPGSWVGAHLRMLQHFRGCPRFLVPEKGRVARRNLDEVYHEMALHYGMTVLPPRKSGLEVESRLLAGLSRQTFHTVVEVEEAAEILLDELNRERLAQGHVERRALLPLAAEPYVFRYNVKATVHLDSHVQLEGHLYSVPCHLIGQCVWIRFNNTVDIYHDGVRVAHHGRSHLRGYTTVEHHLASVSGKRVEWTPARFCSWAARMGPCTERMVCEILNARPHPEQGFRACLGLLKMADRHGADNLERACGEAVLARAFRCRKVQSLLENGLVSPGSRS